MIQQIISILRQWHSDIRHTGYIYMMLVALVVGLLGGLCSVGFRELIHFGQLGVWWQSNNLVEHIRQLPWWWKIGVPTFGGLCVGLITYYFAREAKGHGVPEVMQALVMNGGRIRPRVAIAKIIASALCIGTGGSAGREGPIVQVGSALGSVTGQFLHLSDERIKNLVSCGAAAGIAATFNAPIAGVAFAIEVLMSELQVRMFGNVVIASVSASVVSQMFLGDRPAFSVPSYTLHSPSALFFRSMIYPRAFSSC